LGDSEQIAIGQAWKAFGPDGKILDVSQRLINLLKSLVENTRKLQVSHGKSRGGQRSSPLVSTRVYDGDGDDCGDGDELEPQPTGDNRVSKLTVKHHSLYDNRASIWGFAHSAAIWKFRGGR